MKIKDSSFSSNILQQLFRGDSLEVAGRANVRLGQLLLLAFGLLVLAAQPAVAQHVVEVVRLLVAVGVVESDVVDLWVFDVHRGHVESWTCRQRRGRPGRKVHELRSILTRFTLINQKY